MNRAALALFVMLAACSKDQGDSTSTSTTVAPERPAIVLAAGDIAGCDTNGDEATASLLDRLPGTILGLGDMAYPEGSPEQFSSCYSPSWGRFRDRTKPVPGNHEYDTTDARGFFDYFGVASPGWYSFDLGRWHVVALNSNCDAVGGCGPDSEQVKWLRADLAAHRTTCTLAYWHHPRFSSGAIHGDDATVDGLWQAAVEGGVDVVLNGHEHHYERLAPQDRVRAFVVGTGGRSLYPFRKKPRADSEARNGTSFGVLELTLAPVSYTWRFVPVEGAGFTDEGSGTCR